MRACLSPRFIDHAPLWAILLTGLLTLSACASVSSSPKMVDFTCSDGTALSASFAESSVTVSTQNGSWTLPQQPSGSGINYTDGLRSFRGKGREMQWEFGRMVPLTCMAK